MVRVGVGEEVVGLSRAERQQVLDEFRLPVEFGRGAEGPVAVESRLVEDEFADGDGLVPLPRQDAVGDPVVDPVDEVEFLRQRQPPGEFVATVGDLGQRREVAAPGPGVDPNQSDLVRLGGRAARFVEQSTQHARGERRVTPPALAGNRHRRVVGHTVSDASFVLNSCH